MKAEFTAEDDDHIGLNVIDNAQNTHDLTLRKGSGVIVYHQCEVYADDPRDRTPDENEYNEQARRYARYYVYQERGYDTVEHTENPDYINAVREAIADLSDAEFRQYFGPLHQQLRSHHDDSVDRLVDIPAGARAEDAVIYELDAYLGIDIEDDSIADEVAALSEAHGLDLEAATQPVTDAAENDLADWESVGEHLLDLTDGDVPMNLAAVSGIHVGYPNSQGEHEVQEADDPLDREADARIELMPADPGSIEEFRAYLDHHLRCQVRDCLAGMGLFPPEPFQTVGYGKFIYARRYDHYDL